MWRRGVPLAPGAPAFRMNALPWLVLFAALGCARALDAGTLHARCAAPGPDPACARNGAVCLQTGVGRPPTCGCPEGAAPSPLTGECRVPGLGDTELVTPGTPSRYAGSTHLWLPPSWTCAWGECWARRHPEGALVRVRRPEDVAAVRLGHAELHPSWVQWSCPGGREPRLRAPVAGEPMRDFDDYCPGLTAKEGGAGGADEEAQGEAEEALGGTDCGALGGRVRALSWPDLGQEGCVCGPGHSPVGPRGACRPVAASGAGGAPVLVLGTVPATAGLGTWYPEPRRLEVAHGQAVLVTLLAGGLPPRRAVRPRRGWLLCPGLGLPRRPDGPEPPPLDLWCAAEGDAAHKSGRATHALLHGEPAVACERGAPVQRMRETEHGCRPDGSGCSWERLPVWACDCQDGWFGRLCDVSAEACAAERCSGRGACLGQTRDCECAPGAGGESCANQTTPDPLASLPILRRAAPAPRRRAPPPAPKRALSVGVRRKHVSGNWTPALVLLVGGGLVGFFWVAGLSVAAPWLRAYAGSAVERARMRVAPAKASSWSRQGTLPPKQS